MDEIEQIDGITMDDVTDLLAEKSKQLDLLLLEKAQMNRYVEKLKIMVRQLKNEVVGLSGSIEEMGKQEEAGRARVAELEGELKSLAHYVAEEESTPDPLARQRAKRAAGKTE